MEIVSIERKTFEAMVAKFDRFVHRMEAICQRHGEKKMSEGWTIKMCASCSTSVPAHCKHCGITVRLPTRR